MLKQFFSYYHPYKKLFYLDFGCAILAAILELAFPVVVNRVINKLLPTGHPQRTNHQKNHTEPQHRKIIEQRSVYKKGKLSNTFLYIYSHSSTLNKTRTTKQRLGCFTRSQTLLSLSRWAHRPHKP